MEKQAFTLQEVQAAIVSMPLTKFTHQHFSDDEYIWGDEKGNLRGENGYFLPAGEFFGMCKNSMPDGWYIKKDKPAQKDVKDEKQTNISEKEIQELYAKAKEIIKSKPNQEINISEFNVVYDGVCGDHPQRVDVVRLVKKKLDFIHFATVNDELWEAHMAHLPGEIRRNILKQIVEKYK